MTKITLKGLSEDIVNKYFATIDTDRLRTIISRIVEKNYIDGVEEAEVTFDRNFMPDQRTVEFVRKNSFDNVMKLTTDIRDNLRREVNEALMNRESSNDIRRRVREILNTTIDRAKKIQITETNRAFNMGNFQGANESNLNLVKKWDAQPERKSRAGNMVPCSVCEFLDGKIVELNQRFKDNKGNEHFLPPVHPNCACRVTYIQKEDIEK